MDKNIKTYIKPLRLKGLPDGMRQQLKAERLKHDGSQAELGGRSVLPQMHISGIESGKIVPRFDTLLDLVRVRDHDILLIPRALVPAVQSLIRDYRHHDDLRGSDERSLYAAEDEEPGTEEKRRDEI